MHGARIPGKSGARLGATAACFALLAAGPAAAQREPGVPKELMERVTAWVERTLAAPVSYAAEETLAQRQYGRKGAGAQRIIVSDFVRVRLGEESRSEFEARDLIAVDGKQYQSEAQREEKWKKLAAARTRSEILVLLEDPAKHRLGPERFEGLWRLVSRFSERHADKIRYFFAPDNSDPPMRYTLIGYRQTEGEGLMVVDDKPVKTTGLAWIEPDDGHIARIEEEFALKDSRFNIAVEFGKPAELGEWVPTAVTVRVFEKGRLTFDNQYTYANFRPLGPQPGPTASR